MSDTLKYLGGTKFYNRTENFTRTWQVWGYHTADGELTAIEYGISSQYQCANRGTSRQDCVSPLQKQLWAVAQERLAQNLCYDENDELPLIEPIEDDVIATFARR